VGGGEGTLLVGGGYLHLHSLTLRRGRERGNGGGGRSMRRDGEEVKIL